LLDLILTYFFCNSFKQRFSVSLCLRDLSCYLTLVYFSNSLLSSFFLLLLTSFLLWLSFYCVLNVSRLIISTVYFPLYNSFHSSLLKVTSEGKPIQNFIFLCLLFICAYNVGVISPPFPIQNIDRIFALNFHCLVA
jgi:hypothetical protein